MRKALVLAMLLLVAGCATEAKYKQYVDSFVGQSATQLYAAWGAPVRSGPLPDGGQAVSFLSNISANRGFGLEGCETTFILNPAGTVVAGSFRGQSCYK